MDVLHYWETGVRGLNFVIGAEDAVEGEGARWLEHISSFVGL